MVEKSSAALLIIGFFTLILGVALLTTIAEQEQVLVSKTQVLNESFHFYNCRTENENPTINETAPTCNRTFTNAPAGWKLTGDDACPLTHIVVRNCTADVLTITTDYLTDTTRGILMLVNTSDTTCGTVTGNNHDQENYTYMDYRYCPDNYLTQAWTRSVMDVVVGFFAIALLLVSVGIFYAIMKKEGIIGI